MRIRLRLFFTSQIVTLAVILASAQAADYAPRSGSSGYRAPTTGRTTSGATSGTASGMARNAYAQPAARAGTSASQAATTKPTATAPRPRAAEPTRKDDDSDSAADQIGTPAVEQALKLTPIQKDAEVSSPAAEDVSRCKITARKMGGGVGWVVEDPAGITLRKFIDTNGDNKVDQWCYFKDGVEVYRDIDSDFNAKADLYRWFGTAGSRVGLDKNEDGLIDAWQAISAEEATAEVVAAMANRDPARFARVALSTDEVESLGLGSAKAQALSEKVRDLPAKFREAAGQGSGLTDKSRWSHFSGTQPGIVPAGTEGSLKDVTAYENVVAIVQTGSDHTQVQIGTLVKIGQAWKVIDAPAVVKDNQGLATAGFFFQVATAKGAAPTASAGTSVKSQEVLGDLEKLDAAAAKATTPEEQAQLNGRRADLLERIADEATKPEDRAMWLRQMADMVGAAVQAGTFPGGEKRLEALFERVQRSEKDKPLAGYVRYRQLTAEYGLAVQAKGVDFPKLQSEWLKKLEQFVTDFPRTPDAAEAMLQLAIAQEFAGKEDDAKRWYSQIVANFPDASAAKKAAGAQRRLDSVGKSLSFQGKGTDGRVVELEKYRGQVVVLQYWATYCEPCKADMAILKELLGKYEGKFAVIGVNLDSSEQALATFLGEHRFTWPQVFEPGGQESRPALELGVLTLPTMILVDQDGKVVNRNITATEVEAELRRLVR